MKGATVFLAAFIVMLATALAYANMPPGKQIYDSLNAPETDYPVLGIPVTTLISAIFNGAIYGIVAWLIFAFAQKARKPAA